MSAYCPDMLERIANSLAAQRDWDHAYSDGVMYGMAYMAFMLKFWLELERDERPSARRSLDRVEAEVNRLKAKGMPDPLPDWIERQMLEG